MYSEIAMSLSNSGGWRLSRTVLRTSWFTRALVVSGVLVACFAWYSRKKGIYQMEMVMDKVRKQSISLMIKMVRYHHF